MLTLECQTVYDAICSLAGEEEVYKVVEADEIFSRVPSGFSFDKVKLAAIIRELKDRGYILVKYFTPDEYCLAVVKRLEEHTEQAQPQPDIAPGVGQVAVPVAPQRQKSSSGASKVGAFFAALFGSIIGSAIVAVVTVLIVHFVLK